MKKITIFVMVLVVMFAMTPSLACADDFSTAFQKVVSEIPDGADAAAIGGATTATPNFSSKNPALIAVIDEKELSRNSLYANYGYINFDKGPCVVLGTLSGLRRLSVGVLQITGSDAVSNAGVMSEFDNIKINSSPSIEIQYGLPVQFMKGLYVGARYEYSQSKITTHTTFSDPLDTEIRTESEVHEVGIGALYRHKTFGEKFINLGVSYAHSWDSDKTFIDGISDGVENSHTDQLRIGISANVTSMTMITAEVRQYWFPNAVNNTQFFAGVEQYLLKDSLAIYGGYANGGATVGLGVYFKNGGLNLAYMHRPFRATEDFLGKAEVYMFSAYVTF